MEEVLTPNPFQQAIYDDVQNGKGHTVVLARAGTGKTSTVIGCFRRVPRGANTLMVAFNKKIAEELKNRAPRGVAVSTCHSYGLSTITKRLGRIPLDGDKTYKHFVDLYRGSPNFPRAAARVTCKLVSLAKGTLARTAEEVDALVDDFGLLDSEGEVRRSDLIDDAMRLLARAETDLATIDFDDMVWLPHVLALTGNTFDRVFVDETQDLNAAQIELALKACSRFDGRICAVGDDRQAIYAFRGADSQAIPNIISRLEAKVLPLSVTYRCPRSVVRLANEVVPDLEAGPENPEGSVSWASDAELMQKAAPGDFVLSRINAPLVGKCLAFLKEGRRAIVLGRDIGTNLQGIVRRSKATLVEDLNRYLDEWQTNEVNRLMSKSPPQEPAAQLVVDKADCIRALAENAKTCDEVCGNIERLFTDVNDGNAVVFSTTHKAKGLEANRVWMLAGTYRRGKSTEEDNLWYVAVTRAKQELVMVKKAA